MADANKPLGSFLVVGPTGVGKNELMMALTEFLYDAALATGRIEMSNLIEKNASATLIGAPPGHVGYEAVRPGQDGFALAH